jgi:hypothetical protein
MIIREKVAPFVTIAYEVDSENVNLTQTERPDDGPESSISDIRTTSQVDPSAPMSPGQKSMEKGNLPSGGDLSSPTTKLPKGSQPKQEEAQEHAMSGGPQTKQMPPTGRAGYSSRRQANGESGETNTGAPMSHREYSEKVLGETPPTPCSANTMTFGGRCLNCGYDPEIHGPKQASRKRATIGEDKEDEKEEQMPIDPDESVAIGKLAAAGPGRIAREVLNQTPINFEELAYAVDHAGGLGVIDFEMWGDLNDAVQAKDEEAARKALEAISSAFPGDESYEDISENKQMGSLKRGSEEDGFYRA